MVAVVCLALSSKTRVSLIVSEEYIEEKAGHCEKKNMVVAWLK